MDTAGTLLPGDGVRQGEPVPGAIVAVEVITAAQQACYLLCTLVRRKCFLVLYAPLDVVVPVAHAQLPGHHGATGSLAGAATH